MRAFVYMLRISVILGKSKRRYCLTTEVQKTTRRFKITQGYNYDYDPYNSFFEKQLRFRVKQPNRSWYIVLIRKK